MESTIETDVLCNDVDWQTLAGALPAMDNASRSRLFDRLKTDEQRDRFNDLILRIKHAHRDGAHSENADTPRNRRFNRIGALNEDMLAVADSMDEHELQVMLCRLAQHGLSKRQRQVWVLARYYGFRQREIASKLGDIKQPEVSRLLRRADRALFRLVDEDSEIPHIMKQERCKGYFAPHHRPQLPPGLDEARQIIEQAEAFCTHIIDPYSQSIEVWHDGDGAERIDERGMPIRTPYVKTGFSTLIKKSGNIFPAM